MALMDARPVKMLTPVQHVQQIIIWPVLLVLPVRMVNSHLKDQLPQAHAKLVLKSLAVALVVLAQQHAHNARPTST